MSYYLSLLRSLYDVATKDILQLFPSYRFTWITLLSTHLVALIPQVNGRRLRGTSYRNTLRCLRSLPDYIELVLARSSRPLAPNFYNFDAEDGPSMADADYAESFLRVQASEVGSTDTTMLQYDQQQRLNSSALSESSASIRASRQRVSEWVSSSQLDLAAPNHQRTDALNTVVAQTTNGFTYGQFEPRVGEVSADHCCCCC